MSKLLMFSLLAIVFASTSAVAGYPLTTEMTCSRARAIVKKEGAVVLHSGNGISGRYVSSAWYCDIDEEEVPAWVPTANRAQCLVGYYCREKVQGF